jgi:RNA polymerase sigma factor (sigma-70 family)
MVRQQSNLRARLLSRERPMAALPERADHAAPYNDLDERDAMWSALDQLPPRQRAVLVLRFYEQLSEAEIAAVLGCSPGTVKSQSSKGLARLRHLVGPEQTDASS